MLKNLLKAENLDESTLQKAFEMVKDYCEKKGVNVKDFVHQESSISEAATEIHKGLPFLQRKLMSVKMVESLIRDNIDFIRQQAEKRS